SHCRLSCGGRGHVCPSEPVRVRSVRGPGYSRARKFTYSPRSPSRVIAASARSANSVKAASSPGSRQYPLTVIQNRAVRLGNAVDRAGTRERAPPQRWISTTRAVPSPACPHGPRSAEGHTAELHARFDIVCCLLLDERFIAQ